MSNSHPAIVGHAIQLLFHGGKRVAAITTAVLCVAIYYVAYWMRFEGQISVTQMRLFFSTVAFIVALKLCVFWLFRVFANWGKYLTFHDLVILGKAVTFSSLIMAVTDYLITPDAGIPRSVFLMDWCGTLVTIGGLRSLARFVEEFGNQTMALKLGKPALIVGANDSGESLLRMIRRNSSPQYRPVGFIAAAPDLVGHSIGGVPVLGTLHDTCRIAQEHHHATVLITADELPGKQVRQLVDDAQASNVNVRVIPSYRNLLAGKVALQPRTVSIQDLLRRDPVSLDQSQLRRWLEGRVLLVTGSAGSIGSEICRQLLQFSPRKLLLVDRSETAQFFLERELRDLSRDQDIQVCMADVNDATRMEAIFAQHHPEIIFHAAAYKHVPLMEQNPGEAVKNIVLLTQKLANLADQYSVDSFVMISTDKAVNPTSVMGVCKRVGELYVQSLAESSNCRFVTVRFGNVLGSAGSVVPIFRQQIADGGPVTVTHPDMTRYFMTIPEASQLVIQAGAMGQGGEIFVLDMGEPVRIVDLARDMIRLSGLREGEDIEVEFTGMRPGEKLYEELHVTGERHLETHHPKILVAESQKINRLTVVRGIKRLENLADGPDDSILSQLKELVPQFQRDLTFVPERRAAA